MWTVVRDWNREARREAEKAESIGDNVKRFYIILKLVMSYFLEEVKITYPWSLRKTARRIIPF